jgi:hypothetical protein
MKETRVMRELPFVSTLDGERVLWTGRPRTPGPLLQLESLPLLLVLISSCFVAPIWIRPLFDHPLSPLSLVPVAFFSLLVATLVVWYLTLTFLIPYRTTYYVTDLRVIFSVLILFRLERSVALADIANVTLIKGRGARGSIAFGVPAGAFMRHLSLLDLVRLPPLAFHNIDDVDAAYRTIVDAKNASRPKSDAAA